MPINYLYNSFGITDSHSNQWLPEQFFSRADANEKAFSRALAPADMQMCCLMTREATPHNYTNFADTKRYITHSLL